MRSTITTSSGQRLLLLILGFATAARLDAQPPVADLEPSIVRAVAAARNTIVPLLVHRCRDSASSHEQCLYRVASAVMIDDSGLFLGSAAVALKGSHYEIVLGDQRIPASLLGTDAWTSLCVLRAAAPPSFQPLSAADPALLEAGRLLVILGYSGSFLPQIGLGTVSGVGGAIVSGKLGQFLQFTPLGRLPAQCGAVLDLQGRLLGILPGGPDPGTGMGLAIPAARALELAREIAAYGRVRRPWIGLTVDGPDLALGELLGLVRSASLKVARIEPGSPAARAGLQISDKVLAFDGMPVTTLPALVAKIEAAGVGHTVRLTVDRSGQVQDLQLRIEERPVPPASVPRIEWLGAELVNGEIPPGEGARRQVLVRQVYNAGLAAWLGLQAGDVIVSLNGEPADDVTQFEGTAWMSPASGKIAVELSRAGRTVRLEFPAIDVRTDPMALLLRLLRLEQARSPGALP